MSQVVAFYDRRQCVTPCTSRFRHVRRRRLAGRVGAGRRGSGLDGFFLWDHIHFETAVPFVDPWIALTARRRDRTAALDR